jgi:hypothetical protein
MKLACTLTLSAALITALPASAENVVPTPHFSGIKLEGGGHVTLKHSAVQQVRLIKGSTEFTRFTVDGDDSRSLRIDACNNNCPHQYSLEVEITSPEIDALAISGGGSIETAGAFPQVKELSLAVDGGGRIDARAMASGKANAAVNGGGVIELKADGALTAAVQGGGHIKYWGNPKVTEAVEGGGKVERGE